MTVVTGKTFYEPIIVGEFPLVPVIAIPYGIFMLLNALIRRHHKLFYIGIIALIYFPFLVLSFVA
jgi:hypothetical protein